MAKIIAVAGSKAGPALGRMAAEAIVRTARGMGHSAKAEVLTGDAPRQELTAVDIADADVAILAGDVFVDLKRFDGTRTHGVTAADAIRHTKAVIEAAVGTPRTVPDAAARAADSSTLPATPVAASAPQKTESAAKKFVAITSCPTGIAHTFMAAKALEKGAASLGHAIKVETQGSVGAKNLLTAADIAAADAVVIAADTAVDTSRFAGKRLLRTTTKVALHDGAKTLNDALAAPVEGAGSDLAGDVEQLKAQRSANRTGPYKHLMTGVSYMLPLVTAGGLLIALAFAIGGIDVVKPEHANTLAGALFKIGGGAAFQLFVPVLAAFIAYSIADRPGICAGIVGGMLAQQLGAGFLGGIAAGFFAGYVTAGVNKLTPLPPNLAGLKPVLILPLLSTLIVGLGMLYVIGPPVKAVLDGLTTWLNGIGQGNALLLGLILGAMMGFDMGGPVNKAAYAFSVGLLASRVYGPMAATMAAGMTPPLGLALAATLFKSRFTADERDAGKAAAVLGISFITEGAIPFAAKDPVRVIPCLMAGSAVTGGLSMAFACGLVVPHGGVFVLLIPKAVQHLGPYAVAIMAGTLVTATLLRFTKKPLPAV